MSSQSCAPAGKTRFAFPEDVIRQMYEMGPTKAKTNFDSISLASSTDERNRDVNISPNQGPPKDDKSEISAKVLQQDNILAKYYECSYDDRSSVTSETNVSHGVDHEYRKDDMDYEMEVKQLKTKNESLRAKLNQFESMKLSVDDFKQCIKDSHESEISLLEKQKSDVMLELENVQSHCAKLESFNENLLSENVTLKKKIEHLLSEKNSLEISVDEYVKILEEKVVSFDHVVEERNQLKLQVMRQKEKAEELMTLQQLVKTLTNHRDTLNFQLQELAKKYSQQQDSAKIAVAKLNRTLNELCETKETCDGLLLLINEQYSVIDQLKKKLIALSESKEFYRKWYNVKFKQLNLQTFESESTKRLLSSSSKIFEQTLKKMKAVLFVIEYFKKTSVTHQKIVLLISVIHTALVNLSAEMGECARKFPRVSEFHDESANKSPPSLNRSFSDSHISMKTLAKKNGKPDLSFPSEDIFSVKCALVSFCAGNEALVKNLFSIEYFEGNNRERKIDKINVSIVNQSRLNKLESENADLKAELSVRNEQVLTLQEQVEQSNAIITGVNNFVNELQKSLIEYKEELKNVCSSCMLESIENGSRSVISESGENSSESVRSKNVLKEYQSLITWLKSEFNEMKTMLVALSEKAKTLPFLEEKNLSRLPKGPALNGVLKEPSKVLVTLQKNGAKILTSEKELIDPKTKFSQIEVSDLNQHISKVRKRKYISSLRKQCLPQEVESKLLDNFIRKTSSHLVCNFVETIHSRGMEPGPESMVSKLAIETFSLSQNLFSCLKKIEHIPALHKIFCKTIVQLGDLISNFEIKMEGKKEVSSNSAVVLNLDMFDDSEIPYLLQRILPKRGVLPIFFTTHSNASYLCTITSIRGGKLVRKLSLVAEKKENAILPESNEEPSESLLPPEGRGQFLTAPEFDSLLTTKSSRSQKIPRKAACQKIMETNFSNVLMLLNSNMESNALELRESSSSHNVSRGDTYPKNLETERSQFIISLKSDPTSIPAETSECNSSEIIIREETCPKITGSRSSQFLLSSKSHLELDSLEPSESSSLKVSREETDQKPMETDSSQIPLASKNSLELHHVEKSESNSSQKVLEDSDQRITVTESSQFSILTKRRLDCNSTEMNEFINSQETIRGDSNQKSTEIVPNQISAPLVSLNLSSTELSGFDSAQITLKEDTCQKDLKDSENILSSLKHDVECLVKNSVDSNSEHTAVEQIHNSLCGNNVSVEMNRCSSDDSKFLRSIADSETTVSECMSRRMTLQSPSSEAMSTTQKQDSEVLRPKSKTCSRSSSQEVSKYSLIARVCPIKYQIHETAILDKLSEVLPYCTVKQYNEFLVRCAEKFRLNPEELFFWSVFRTALSSPLAKFSQKLISLINAIICDQLIVIKSKVVRNQMLKTLWLNEAKIEVSSSCIENFDGFEKALSNLSKSHQKSIYFALKALINSSPDTNSFSVIHGLPFTCDYVETMRVNLLDPEIRNACLGVETSNRLKYSESFQPIGVTSGSDFSKNLENANLMEPTTHFQTVEEELIGLQTVESMTQTEESFCENCLNISAGTSGVLQKTNCCNCVNGSTKVSASKFARFVKNSNKPAKKNWFIQLNYLRLKNFKVQKQLSNFKVEFLSLKNLKSLSDFEERLKKLNEFLMEKNEVPNFDEIKKSYEERFVELRKAYEVDKAGSVAKIENLYERRIIDLRKAYEEKLTKLREGHDKDFKSLSRSYVEKLKIANEVYSQSLESIEDTNLRKLEEYQRFYEIRAGEWEAVINNFSQEVINLQKHFTELEEKYSMELLGAKNKFETLFNLICEAFDNEKVAIYSLLSESMNNFEDDFKDRLRKIAARLDRDASISNRLFVKELERCRRQYEHNLKKQKLCYKNLLEEAKKRFEKKVSQKSLSFSKVLICNCDAAVSFKDPQTSDVNQALERSHCDGSSCHTNVADCCAVWECESPC